MRSILILSVALAGIAVVGIATLETWSSPSRAHRLTASAVAASPSDDFAEQLIAFAHDVMSDSPELRPDVEKLAAAIGGDAVAQDIAEKRRLGAIEIENARSEEQAIRHRLEQLSNENARLERITNAQRQVVTDLMSEWQAGQDRTNRFADAKGFSLSILANWVSGSLLVVAAAVIRRMQPSPDNDRAIRRVQALRG